MFSELVARQVKWLIFECVPQVKVRSLDVIVALLVGSIVVVIVSRGMLVRASGLSLAMLALLLLLSFLVLLFLWIFSISLIRAAFSTVEKGPIVAFAGNHLCGDFLVGVTDIFTF